MAAERPPTDGTFQGVPMMPPSFGSAAADAAMGTTPPGSRTPGGRPAPTLGASPPASRPRVRDTAQVPAALSINKG